MATTFRDRLRMVIGNVPFSRWAKERGLQPSSLEEWLEKGRTPRRSSVRNLAEKTGIPEVWWLESDGEPPPPNGQQICASCHSAAEPVAEPYQGKGGGVDAVLLQQVIDLFYAWLDEHRESVRIDRSKHGAVIAVLYRMAEQRGRAEKLDLEQVLSLAA